MEKNYFLYYLDSRLRLVPGEVYTIGRSHTNCILLPHLSVSRTHASLNWSEQGFAITDLDSTNGLFVNKRRVRNRLLVNGDKLKIGDFNLQYIERDGSEEIEPIDTILPSPTLAMERTVAELLNHVQDPELIAKIMELKHSFEKKREELSDMAFKDELTRVYNRRYFDEKLTEECTRAFALQRSLSLVMIDIDHFKEINDTHGHQKGDEILRMIAGLLHESVRGEDTVARYGGEEIAVILPGVELSIGLRIAERFRKSVERQIRVHTGIHCTISLGVAALGDGIDSSNKMIFEADRAMYRAKQAGRNRVIGARM